MMPITDAEFDTAVAAAEPGKALHALVVSRLTAGAGCDEIYGAFLDYYGLTDGLTEAQDEALCDAMEHLVGWSSATAYHYRDADPTSGPKYD